MLNINQYLHSKSERVGLFCHLGLPEDTTEEEFVEFMSKCGIIMEDNGTS